MGKIYILKGTVHTGKTTRLMQWASSQKNIDGIFQPCIDEKRFIYHIASRTLRMLESPLESVDEKIIKIGNYRFRESVFLWAQNALIDSLNKNFEWLIIDEIGPLELEGKGLEPAVSKILMGNENYKSNILCVVRDSILEKFIEHYNLQSKFGLFELPRNDQE